MTPVFKFGSQRLVHQQAGKTAAVDKQISLHRLTGFQHNFRDVSGFSLTYLSYFALDPGYAIFFGKLTQVLGITCGINMVGITQPIFWQQAKPVCLCGHQLWGIAAIVFSKTQLPGFEPEMLEACGPAALACDAK